MNGVRPEDRCTYLRPFCGLRVDAGVCLAIFGMLLFGLTTRAATQPDVKNVLVLFSTTAGDPHFLSFTEAAIRNRVQSPIAFYYAYLVDDDDEEVREHYWDSQAETFRRTYAGKKLDLVIALSPHGVYFALRFRDRIFAGVPIVFAEVSTKEFEGRSWPGVTGMTIPDGIGETVDLALHLQPDTSTVAVISNPEKLWLSITHSELQRRHVKAIYFVEPPSRELIEKVDALPPHTVVLFQLSPPDASHLATGALEVLDAVAKRWPTYSEFPTICLNHGCLGGAFGDGPKQDASIIELASRVLSGDHPDDIPVIHNSNTQIQVDWRALQRWHIPESALPAGSVVLYRPPSFWESYRKSLIAAIVAIAALLLLIVGLLRQRTRKRKAEALLLESEKRFKVMADTTPALIWMCDSQGSITYLNDRRVAFTGLDPNAGYGNTWIAYIHPDDQKNVSDAVTQALQTRQPFSKEYRLRRSDGVYRWMLDVATPRVNGDGTFAGFIGSAIDTTDQKLAQQALEKVSGQMIEAQEKERSRIARDLHDDICQRLALLSMEIDQAKRVSGDSPETTRQKLQEIRKHCSEITGDVQSLSHQLHSSKLESLGIEAAIRGFCREFSKQHDVHIELTCREVPMHLPKEISLCLFRVAQEALQNAMKYSGVTEFTVELLILEGEIHLAVDDEGAGFDVDEAKRNQGLGLMSMQERVHLVQGALSVESKPGAGTHILAVVPLDGRSLKDEEVQKHAIVTRI